MVKSIKVAQSRPVARTLPATDCRERQASLLRTQSPEPALKDVTSEHQSNGRKQKARATHLKTATAVDRQTRRTHVQTDKAIKEELQCIADLKLYAAYLGVESGVLLDHPWIQKLIDVSNRRLDPHELLKIYREDPGSLSIADRKTPNLHWSPPEAEGTVPLQSINRSAAMRALVGKDNWRESPALQALREKAKHIAQPSNLRRPKPQEGLESFIAYIAEKERLGFMKDNSNDVSHQGKADAMEA